MGVNTNEYEFIDENGVLEVLGSRYHSSVTIFPSFEHKKLNEFKVYQRPTIPWSLECEIEQGFSREEAFKIFEFRYVILTEMQSMGGFLTSSLILLLILGARCEFCNLRRLFDSRNDDKKILMAYLGFATFTAASIMAKPTKLILE